MYKFLHRNKCDIKRDSFTFTKVGRIVSGLEMKAKMLAENVLFNVIHSINSSKYEFVTMPNKLHKALIQSPIEDF